MVPPGVADFAEAAFSAGEAFEDSAAGITVSHLSTDSEKRCLVRLERGTVSAPDPYIKRGVVVEAADGGGKHTSRYIWVDSGENGWDIYPEKAPVTRIAWQPVPWTDGDPILAGEDAQTIRKKLDERVFPNLLLAGGARPGDLHILAGRFQPGKTLIYICQNQTCSPPMEDPDQVLSRLQS